MARRSISLALALGLAAAGYPQAFGRFGYTDQPRVPGWKVDRAGIAADQGTADAFRFAAPSKIWKPIATSDIGQTILLSGTPWSPDKLRLDLTSPGVQLHFAAGIDFRLSSTASPYLSWADGSVTNGIPAPAAPWVLVSFPDKQPPVLLVFQNAKVSLMIQGKPGAWEIRSEKRDPVWLKALLPIGTTPFPTNSAATLGQATRAVQAEPLWLKESPKLLVTKIQSDLVSVTVTWSFDRPGAVVPVGVLLAQIGGYPLRVESKTRRIAGPTAEGPLDVTDEKDLVIRFPVRRIPTGRCLPLGAQPGRPIGTVSPFDVPSLSDLALETLLASRDPQSRISGEDALQTFLQETTYAAEPWTGQQLPYEASGHGIDLVGAQALLMQCLTSTTQATSEANSLLTSLCWRRDWYTWRLWCDEPVAARRAAALGAVCATLCPEPERRFEGALLEAGIAAERGLNIYRRRLGEIPTEPKLIEPLSDLRRTLFNLDPQRMAADPFAASLLAELRVFGDIPITLEQRTEGLVMVWRAEEVKPGSMMLASAFQLEIAPLKNLARATVAQTLGFTQLSYTPEKSGQCEAVVTFPKWAKTPPMAAPAPSYSETAR